MCRKLADQRGDTMVEALAAILIAALGATMLATMVVASVSVASRSERVLNDAYADESGLYGAGTLSKVIVRVPSDTSLSSDDYPIDVTLFTSGEYSCYSSSVQPADEGEGVS
ncbi:hypothetical protein GJG86_04585 [Eggerthella sp. HF-4214]|uniref:Uncharacterized protein n=2 Tax=Eggerthella guodeyinii TaxID=2690837 RepID=A0A6N7RLY1_9ACTN|nr:hypothetical protein [Eggerthella guodeyinii]